MRKAGGVSVGQLQDEKARALTDEANVADVVDYAAAVELAHRSKQHRAGRKAEHVDGYAKRAQQSAGAAKLPHQLRYTRCEHGYADC